MTLEAAVELFAAALAAGVALGLLAVFTKVRG